MYLQYGVPESNRMCSKLIWPYGQMSVCKHLCTLFTFSFMLFYVDWTSDMNGTSNFQLKNLCPDSYSCFCGFGAHQLDGEDIRACYKCVIQWYRQAVNIQHPTWIEKVKIGLLSLFSRFIVSGFFFFHFVWKNLICFFFGWKNILIEFKLEYSVLGAWPLLVLSVILLTEMAIQSLHDIVKARC